MTCWNNTRIYNEDEDTGYTVTLMEGLRHCMVFNDDGTPRQLEGMEDPIDARDLEQVRVPFPLSKPFLIEPLGVLAALGDGRQWPSAVQEH